MRRIDHALGKIVEVADDRQVAGHVARPPVPTKLPIQLITQSSRNTANVTMPATIWFLVRLEMNRPSEMKQAPSRRRPR